MKFDGTAYINVIIEKNDQSKGGATKEQIDEMTDLMKISKLVKHSRKKKLKNGGPENVITILSYHKRYNYITANLLYEDSPAILCANFHLYNQESPFKAAWIADNFELALKLLDYSSAREILDGVFRRSQSANVQLIKILQSEYLYEFLIKIAERKKEIESVMKPDEFRFVFCYEPFDVDEPQKENAGEGDEEGEGDMNYNEDKSVFFLWYQGRSVYKKVGREISFFNCLFANYRYYLDETVKVLSVKQIKKLNEMGYVIGQYFHQDTSYKKQEILPMCYEISQNKDKKVYSKYAKINQSLREANWTTLRNKEGTADYALKYALRQYKATNGENAEMVDYLIKILEKKIPEIQLMIPELIWLLCKYFPSDHKYIKMFLPNAKAYRDYILLEGGRDLDPRVENGTHLKFLFCELAIILSDNRIIV